jgi:Tyrosine phosphatase family
MTAPRWVRFDGIVNFRDLGGHPAAGDSAIRWRTVYRSGALDAMSPADGAALRTECGVRTVIDLRRADEIPAALPERLGRLGIAHHNVPLGRGGPGPTDQAAFLLDRCHPARPGIAAAIRLLGRPDVPPAVLACRLGRDRTGLVTMFLLALLGVPAERIAGEFALTAQALRGPPDELVAQACAVLAGLCVRYGDLASALRPYGVDDAVVQTLRRRLISRLPARF